MKKLHPGEVLLLISPILLVSLLAVSLLLIAVRGHPQPSPTPKLSDIHNNEFADLERESPGQLEMITVASLTPIVVS